MNYIQPISDELKKDTVVKGIWNEACPISLDRMTIVNVNYLDFTGNICSGQIMVFDVLADSVAHIFEELLEMKFPIHRVSLINEFSGDDHEAMKANNTSAFNCRKIENADRFSMHSYGMAVDINPVQNPVLYLEDPKRILPKEGEKYLDRDIKSPGVITEEVVGVFRKHHFSIWGGDWESLKDWHHFQVSQELKDQLSNLGLEEGKALLGEL